MYLLPLHLWQSRIIMCSPKINENGVIDIKGGRHPVVEKMINNDMFIANDTYLDNGKQPHLHHYRTEYGRKIHLYAPDAH